MKIISEELLEFEKLIHIKSVDRRTDARTDRNGDNYRAPAFLVHIPNKISL